MPREVERRFVEVRLASGQDARSLVGVVVRYGDEARIGGEFVETVRAGAMRFDDVTVNRQHDRSLIIARTGAGLTLTDSPTGLEMRADLPPTRIATDTLEAVRAGLLRGLSVEMRVERDKWTKRGGILHRAVEAARLVGIAVVDRPAYAKSVVAARALVEAASVGRRRSRLWL